MAGSAKQLKPKVKLSRGLLLAKYKQAVSMYNLESSIGLLLRYLAITIFIFINLYEFSRGRFLLQEFLTVHTWTNEVLILSASISIYVYSLYLTRDKDKYQTINHRDLHDITTNEKTCEFANYCSREFLEIIGRFLDQRSKKGTDYDAIKLVTTLFSSPNNLLILKRLGLEERDIKLLVQKYAEVKPKWPEQVFEENLKKSFDLALNYNFDYVDERALLITLLKYELVDSLQAFSIKQTTIDSILIWLSSQNYKKQLLDKISTNRVLKPFSNVNAAMTSMYSPTVEKFSEDLTNLAARESRARNKDKRHARFQITYRNQQLKQVNSILDSEEGLCLLVGKSGVGKTTLIETVALEILAKMVPKSLRDKRLLELNITRILSQVKSSKDIAKILQNIFLEQEKSGNMILVLDDIDELFNLEPNLQQTVISILSAQLRKVEVELIATITPSNYEKYFMQFEEIASLFSKVEIQEADQELSLQILLDELQYFEKKYGVHAEYPALRRICELAPQYEFSKHMPDKVIDMLDEIMQMAKDKGEGYVNKEFVDEIIEHKVGLKLGLGGGEVDQEEKNLLLNLETEIRKYIIGQNEAVDLVCKALRRARMGLKKENKPTAAFLFFGPTGVGKTELSKTIARVYFGDEKLFHRLDMSEFQNPDDIGRLIGYRQDNEYYDGLLTQFVLQNPFSIILLDELEKANQKIMDIFLQILDNAKVTDGAGREVSFENTIIVATSNAGSNLIASQMNAGKSYKQIKPLAFEELKKVFRIEFLNRFDAVVMFHPLSFVDAEKIAKMLLFNKKEELKQKGIEFVFSDKLVRQLVSEGFSQEFGARSLMRKVTDLIEDKVAEAMVKGVLKPGDIFSLE